jgi:hypothetical protein
VAEIDLDLEHELQCLRAEIDRLESQLAMLDDRYDLTKDKFWMQQVDLVMRSRAEELDELVCSRVLTHALDQMNLRTAVRIQGFFVEGLGELPPVDPLSALFWRHERELVTPTDFEKGVKRFTGGLPSSALHPLPAGGLLSAHYVPDASTNDKRDLTLSLPLRYLDTIRHREPVYELIALGSSEDVLVVGGSTLWSWVVGGFRWWQRGEIRFEFERKVSTDRVWLRSVTQVRPWGRGEQTHTCRWEPVEVTRYLNRFDMLQGEEG